MSKQTINCPSCGAKRELRPKAGNPKRLVAKCDCTGYLREVYETNAPEPAPKKRSSRRKSKPAREDDKENEL